MYKGGLNAQGMLYQSYSGAYEGCGFSKMVLHRGREYDTAYFKRIWVKCRKMILVTYK